MGRSVLEIGRSPTGAVLVVIHKHITAGVFKTSTSYIRRGSLLRPDLPHNTGYPYPTGMSESPCALVRPGLDKVQHMFPLLSM